MEGMDGMKPAITWRQHCILRVLHLSGEALSPSTIGEVCRTSVGYSKNRSTSEWACPKLKSLVAAGLVDAIPHEHGGHWYKITPAGFDAYLSF